MNISVNEVDRGLPPDEDGDRLAQDGTTSSLDRAAKQNQLIKEHHNLIRAGGATPDENTLTQLRDILIPAGEIKEFACALPSGFLPCDGAAVSREDYARLFAAISTTWGAGDTINTFNVPDLRGRTLIGSGTGSGLTARTLAATGGEEAHTLSLNETVNHSHSSGGGSGLLTDGATGGNANIDASSSSYKIQPAANFTVTNHAGSTSAHNTMPPFAVVNYGIRY